MWKEEMEFTDAEIAEQRRERIIELEELCNNLEAECSLYASDKEKWEEAYHREVASHGRTASGIVAKEIDYRIVIEFITLQFRDKIKKLEKALIEIARCGGCQDCYCTAFEALEGKKYKYIARIDEKTCDSCKELDGEMGVFAPNSQCDHLYDEIGCRCESKKEVDESQ